MVMSRILHRWQQLRQMKELRRMETQREDERREQREDERREQMKYQQRRLMENILIYLMLFAIVSVPIVLILMGGYAAYFGYLLATLVFLCIVVFVVACVRWIVGLAESWQHM
jgi:cation transport ATPase